MMMVDGQMQEHQYQDQLALPPFNPTDYFREMIFATDFLLEDDINAVDAGNNNTDSMSADRAAPFVPNDG